MTVTLETLHADYNEVDFEIVDLIEQLRHGHVIGGPQTPQFNADMTKLLALLNTLPVMRAYSIVCHLIFDIRIYFDPLHIAGWDEFFSKARDHILGQTNSYEEGRRWFKEATLALIATRFDEDAALLFRLSDGAIDPRAQP